MGALAGLGSIAGGLFGMFGGGPQPPQIQQAPGLDTAYSGALAGIQSLPGTNLGGTTIPLAQNTALGLYNSPTGAQFQAGANVAGGLGQNAALQQYYGGVNQAGAYGQLTPYAQQTLQTGFDPQSALYTQLLNQTTQQQNVANVQAGVATSPYGASLADQNIQNFNIAWQNAQLGRQAQAASTAEGLYGTGANVAGQGYGLMAAAPGQYLTASGMPYTTQQGIGTGQFSDLSQLQSIASGAQGLAQTPIQDYLGYVSAGQNAEQLQLQSEQQAFNQQQIYGSEIGGGLYGLGNAFSGSPYGGYTGTYGSPYAYGAGGYYGAGPYA